MKRLMFLFFLLSILTHQEMRAQSDPNNDPNWDWRASQVFIVYPQLPSGEGVPTTSPFYQGGISEAVFDNHPDDGWKLVLRDFGTPQRGQAIPHFILYNKYQGLLRIFVFVKAQNNFGDGGIELRWGTQIRTAALTFLKSRAWALDRLDSVKNNSSVASTPAADNHWSFADFPFAYDPSTAGASNARLHFRVWGVQEYTIELESFGDLRQVFGNNQPANIPTPGLLSQGGLFDAGLKNAQATQATWNGWRDKIGQIANGIDSNSSSSSVRNLRSNLLALKNSWLVSNLGIIGVGVGLIDFFLTGGRSTSQERPAPMNFLLNFRTTGTMRTQFLISPGVTLPVPGAPHTEPSIPVNLIYTHPLGIFNLRNTTILQSRGYQQPIGPNLTTSFRSYRVKEDLVFDVNPTAELQLQSIEAALVYHVYPGWESFFLNWADQGLVELESANNGKYAFRSPYVDAHWFRFQRINVSLSTDVTIKIKAVFNRVNAPPGTQPVVFVGTYEPVFEPGDGVAQPWPAAPQGVTINTTREYEFDPSEQSPIQYGYIGVQTNVSTPPQITVGGKDYRFYGWSDGIMQNPRSVTPSGNLNFTALYKAHMTTVSAAAISGSSQRKIIRDGNGYLFACYESGGHIWLSRSTNNGTSWGNEVKMSDDVAGFTNRAPCVSRTYLAINNKVLVAWEAFGYSGGNYINKVYLRAIDPVAFNSVVHMYMYQTQSAYPFTSMPMVAPSFGISTIPTLFAWFDPSGPSIRGRVVDYPQGPVIIFQGNVTSSFTLAVNDMNQGPYWARPTWRLAWSAGSTLYSGSCELNSSNQLVPISSEIVTENGGGIGELSMIYYTPASVSRLPAVSWVDNGLASGPGCSSSYSVRYRERSSAGWNTPITTWADVYCGVTSPSLTYNYTNNSVSLIWQGGTTVRNSTKVGGSWSAVSTIVNGVTPSVSISVPGNVQSLIEVLLSRSVAGSPYAIQRTPIMFAADEGDGDHVASLSKGGGGLLSPQADSTVAEGRGGRMVFANGEMHIVILSASLNGQVLRFPKITDSLHVLRRQQIDSAATTLPFVGVGTLDLKVLYRTSGVVPNAAQFGLEARDASTGIVLGKLRAFANVGDTTLTLHVPLNFPGRTITVGLMANNMNSVREFTLERWFLPSEESNSSIAGLLKTEHMSERPTEFALHQNFPNPFNPTTEIRFDLPDAGNVSLAIYDVLGREVANLVSGYREPGYHSATWVATEHASGVYFARFTSSDATGRVVFSKLNKLLLVK